MSVRANLFSGQGSLSVETENDTPGRVKIEGPEFLVELFADWLQTATGFAGHLCGYPYATPRNVAAALLNPDAIGWRASEIVLSEDDPADALPLTVVD